MIHEEYSERTFTKKIVTRRKLYCDQCGETIEEYNIENDHSDKLSKRHEKRIKYWEVTTGHHDWGADSIDSVEESHYCSKECLTDAFNEYLKWTSKEKYDGTAYFDISVEYA